MYEISKIWSILFWFGLAIASSNFDEVQKISKFKICHFCGVLWDSIIGPIDFCGDLWDSILCLLDFCGTQNRKKKHLPLLWGSVGLNIRYNWILSGFCETAYNIFWTSVGLRIVKRNICHFCGVLWDSIIGLIDFCGVLWDPITGQFDFFGVLWDSVL